MSRTPNAIGFPQYFWGGAASAGGTSIPVAGFTGTPLSGTPPLAVTFADASTNVPTSWHWEKNDGSGWVDFSGTPTAQNPSESFAAGTWSIRLTATNTAGSNTTTQTNYISALPVAIAAATHYWRLGTDLADKKGSSDLVVNPLDPSATVGTASGHLGLASTFSITGGNGPSGNYLVTPDTPSLKWTADKTIWGWFKYVSPTSFNGLFGKGAEKPDIWFTNTGSDIFQVNAGAANADFAAPTPSSAFHFFAVTFSLTGGSGGTGLITVYMDDPTSAVGTLDSIGSLADTGTFRVGGTAGFNNFEGSLEQFGVCPSVLSGSDLAFLWNSGTGRQVF